MRKLTKCGLLLTLLILFHHLSFSQIPNPGFENWTSMGYQNPNGWGNLNSSTWLGGFGVLTCERGTGADVHSGSYSMKLTSKSVFGLGDAPGIAFTGTINTSNQTLEGGFAYTQRSPSLKGWYKYSPASGDNGEIRVTLWRRTGGVRDTVGEGVINPSVTVSTLTSFSVPITYSSANAPDSGAILLVSTNTNSIKIGSVLVVDDLELVDCSGFSVSLATTDVTTVGGADGSATATVTGGTPPYGYYWTPSQQATSTIVNLGAGSYCVTVSDDNGCTATTSCATVSGPDCSGFSVSVSTTDATTTGGADGTATVHLTGATGLPDINWNTSDTSITIVGLTSGTYCASVTDGIGCSDSACGIVSDPGCANFSVTLSITDVSMVGGSDGEIIVTPTGGTSPYTYVWSDGGNGQNLSAGHYCVTVTDDVGCQDIQCIDVFEPSCSGFSVSVTGSDVTTVNGNDGTVSTSVSGGVPAYSYSWSTGDTTQDLTGLSDGVYCVTVTDAVGCTTEACDTVNEPDCSGFSVSVIATDETAVGANNGTASATPAGGVPSIQYEWSNGSTAQNISSLSPGSYCVTATDAVGCSATSCDSVNAGTVGISGLEADYIKLFPNPASDAVTIELNNTVDYRFRLFDIMGKVITEMILNEKSSVITLSDFAAGTYLYELKNKDNGNTVTGKLMKE